MKLWNKQQEKLFFLNSRSFASTEQLFYRTDDDRYLAYWPKRYKGRKTTLHMVECIFLEAKRFLPKIPFFY